MLCGRLLACCYAITIHRACFVLSITQCLVCCLCVLCVQTVCRQLGFSGGVFQRPDYAFNDASSCYFRCGSDFSTPAVWGAPLNCSDDDARLADCAGFESLWDALVPDHGYDVGVRCDPPSTSLHVELELPSAVLQEATQPDSWTVRAHVLCARDAAVTHGYIYIRVCARLAAGTYLARATWPIAGERVLRR